MRPSAIMCQMPLAMLLGLSAASPTDVWAASRPVTIKMESHAPYYRPSMLLVAPEASITWLNETPTAHSVTHDGCTSGRPCLFDSGVMQPHASFEIEGLQPGRYRYHCRLHPIMQGFVIVGESPDAVSGWKGQ